MQRSIKSGAGGITHINNKILKKILKMEDTFPIGWAMYQHKNDVWKANTKQVQAMFA